LHADRLKGEVVRLRRGGEESKKQKEKKKKNKFKPS